MLNVRLLVLPKVGCFCSVFVFMRVGLATTLSLSFGAFLMNDVMELSDYQNLLTSYLAGEATLTDQQKFDYLDVFFNYLSDCKSLAFPIHVMKQFAKDLGNPMFNGHPVLLHLDMIV